jgi:hypothetical protein
MTGAQELEMGMEFFRCIENGDYPAAASVISQLFSSGETTEAGRLLALLHQATKSVSVKQTMTTIEAGSTVIGYQGGRR